MDQVSTLLGNILSSDETNKANKNRRSLDLDFTSFWNNDKIETQVENENVSEQVSNITSSQYMADRLMEKALAMIIPTEIHDYQTTKIIQDRIAIQKQRPSLSFNIMQKNSNMLHQRNSTNNILINNIIQFFNWDDVYYTVGVLLIITLVVLNPVLLTIIPLVMILVKVLIPHYLLVYPPESTKYLNVNPIPAKTPLGKYKIAKPVPLFSQEFFLNLTDTQNFMTFYIDTYDFIVWITRDYLYFKDEQISSIVFLLIFVTILLNFYLVPILVKFAISHLVFVKMNIIGFIWLFVIIVHPKNRSWLLEWIYNEDTRLNFQNNVNKIEAKFSSILHETKLEEDSRFVEIYELQRLDLVSKMWEFIGFTPNFYTINTATRQYNMSLAKVEEETLESTPKYLRIPRKDSLSEILPPKHYQFSGNWTIDYNVNNWVEENLIKDLVIIDDDEKWAYDYIEEFNDVDETNEIMEIFRRRRWIRKVIRSKVV